MAPPSLPLRHYADSSVTAARQVTEDTPPDFLQGSMKLKVTLPSGKQTSINVHRSTPMMDVLVQVTSANKINPGNHAIRVICNNRNVSYKPSTAVGSLDTSAIEIISKTNSEEGNNRDDKQYKDKKVRLKEWVYKQKLVVNLPKNQLAVYRLPPKTLISEVLSMICEDKNLEEDRFEIRHPVNVDERLRGSCSLSDYQLQEVCIVSKNYRPPPLSVNDLFAMSSLSHHHEDRKRRGFRAFFSRKNKHSNTGNSSLSSGSTGDRSESPENESAKMQSSMLSLNVTEGLKYRLAGQKLSRPTSLLNLNRVTKKRPAPMPPPQSAANGNFVNGSVAATSCHNLSVDDGSRTLTPLSSKVEEERTFSSRSCSRNSNSSTGEFGGASKMKRKAPLPPQTKANSEEAVSSHDKNSSISPSPDLPMFVENGTRSTTPSEVSIDVRPSSSDVSDVIVEEEVQQDAPLALISARCDSASSAHNRANEDANVSKSIPEDLKDSSVSGAQSSELFKELTVCDKLNEVRDEDAIEVETIPEPAPLLEENYEEDRTKIDTSSDSASKLEQKTADGTELYITSESANPSEKNNETEIESNSESVSIDEESSARKPIETLDEILDKAEADLNETSSHDIADDLTIGDDKVTLLPCEQVASQNSGNQSSNDVNQEVRVVDETASTKVIRLNSVAEAVNEVWNSPAISNHETTETRSFRSKVKENEIGKTRNEYKEKSTLVFNFVENISEKGRKKNSLDQSFKTESKEKFVTDVDSLSDAEEMGDSLETVSTSNYNVILKMKPQPRPRTETGRKSPSSDSTCSYYSFRTDSETKSRSNTDASYESVPPPLPSQPIPEVSERDDEASVYSIVSSASSNEAVDGQRHDFDTAMVKDFSHTRPKMFTISTYNNRNQKSSYTKRLTRSESLQNISRPLEKDKIDAARTHSLQRNQSTRNDVAKNNSIDGSSSLERSHRFRTGAKEELEKTPKIVEENVNLSIRDEEAFKKMVKPTIPLRVSKWYQEFNKEYIGPRTKQTNLRKTKSTADIRMNDGQPQAGGPDPGLAHEYVKLQNDFMKWQNQLMQNQNLLHSKVAPIAAPNMMMGQNIQMPYNVEPEAPKRREINIPIRMEGESDTFVNQTHAFGTTDNTKTMGNNGVPNNLINQSQGIWNQPPNVTMGAWNDRPTNVECVVVTDPPHVFQAPQDPRFMPVFAQRESNPTGGFRSGIFPPESAFREPQFEPPTNFGTNNNQFGVFPSRPQFAGESIPQQKTPMSRAHEIPAADGQFQPVSGRAANVNTRNEAVNKMPTFSSSQKMPSFTPQPMARDDPSGKFTSVTTLSNDSDNHASARKGGSPQFNNMSFASNNPGDAAISDGPAYQQQQPTWRNNGNKVANNGSASWKKSPSPEKMSINESFTPMSSRLVQAASTQPAAFDPMAANASSNVNDGPRSTFTPIIPTCASHHTATYDDNNSAGQPTSSNFELRPQQAANVNPRQSPKPQLVEPPRPPPPKPQQTFSPMPKFEPPPSFQPESEPMRISPPRRQKKSPSPMRQDVPAGNTSEGRPSPIRDQLSDSFAAMKAPSATPDSFPSQMGAVPPCPDFPADVPPPPPPPPPRMNNEVRRTSTGKKIFSSNKAPELDAREELMMAIRKFGGSNNLRPTGTQLDLDQ